MAPRWTSNTRTMRRDNYNKVLLLACSTIHSSSSPTLWQTCHNEWCDNYMVKSICTDQAKLVSSKKNSDRVSSFWDHKLDWLTCHWVVYCCHVELYQLSQLHTHSEVTVAVYPHLETVEKWKLHLTNSSPASNQPDNNYDEIRYIREHYYMLDEPKKMWGMTY